MTYIVSIETRSNCLTCGVAIPYAGVGMPAKFCQDHRNPHNRTRDRRIAESNSMPTAGAPVGPALRRGDDSRRMAIGLSITPDPEMAALAVGLTLTKDEAHALEQKARKAHAALCNGNKAAIAHMGHQFIALAFDQLLATHHTMGPNQIPAAIKSVVQALDLYSGGLHQAHAKIELNVSPPTKAELAQWEKDEQLEARH